MARAALFLLALCVAAGAVAQSGDQPAAPPGAAPQGPTLQPANPLPAKKADAKAADAKAQAKSSAKPKKPGARSKPAWAELNGSQQEVLAPLKADWENLERERKLKWIGIANRYPKMKPDAQARVQKRMQTWASLTPEQRRQARENYRQLAKKLPPEKRKSLREQWAEYQQLSPQERQSLVPDQPEPPKKKKK